jgi:hypothetical protein
MTLQCQLLLCECCSRYYCLQSQSCLPLQLFGNHSPTRKQPAAEDLTIRTKARPCNNKNQGVSIPCHLHLCYGLAMHKLHENHQKHAIHLENEKSTQLKEPSMLRLLPIHNEPAEVALRTVKVPLFSYYEGKSFQERLIKNNGLTT